MNVNAAQPAPRRGRPPRIGRAGIIEAATRLGLDSFSMDAIADDSFAFDLEVLVAGLASRLDDQVR